MRITYFCVRMTKVSPQPTFYSGIFTTYLCMIFACVICTSCHHFPSLGVPRDAPKSIPSEDSHCIFGGIPRAITWEFPFHCSLIRRKLKFPSSFKDSLKMSASCLREEKLIINTCSYKMTFFFLIDSHWKNISLDIHN